MNVAPEHVFHFQDGQKAHNLHALHQALETMSEETYQHHVDVDNNDFANWVEFVYRNKPLADDLRKAPSQKAMLEVLDGELGKYSGEQVADEPVDDPAWLFSKPAKLSDPPQSLVTADGKVVHSISTEAPHTFVIKEFLWGLLAGALLGFIVFASLLYLGVFGLV